MRWYNKILKLFGDRRILTHDEYWRQVRADLTARHIIVVEARQYELLRDIAALADIATRHPDSTGLENGLEAAKRLRSAVLTYKIVEQDMIDGKPIPPSANRTREVHLMDIPG